MPKDKNSIYIDEHFINLPKLIETTLAEASDLDKLKIFPDLCFLLGLLQFADSQFHQAIDLLTHALNLYILPLNKNYIAAKLYLAKSYCCISQYFAAQRNFSELEVYFASLKEQQRPSPWEREFLDTYEGFHYAIYRGRNTLSTLFAPRTNTEQKEAVIKDIQAFSNDFFKRIIRW